MTSMTARTRPLAAIERQTMLAGRARRVAIWSAVDAGRGRGRCGDAGYLDRSAPDQDRRDGVQPRLRGARVADPGARLAAASSSRDHPVLVESGRRDGVCG